MNAMKRAGGLRVWAKDIARLGIGMLLLVGVLVAPVHAGVTVTYTGPADGTVYNNPPINSITLTATASASQGYTLSKVEFFHGGTNLIGTDTTSPYSFDWTNVPAGTYVVTAVATAVKKNSPNETATSSSATLIVNASPGVSLTSPVANAVYAWSPGFGGQPASIPLSVNVSDSDGTISSVQYFHGGTNLIDTVNSHPFSSNFATSTSGNYSITAVVTDSHNASTTSAAVPVTVTQRPSAFITSPENFSIFPVGANITVAADAADADGTVTQVDFSNGVQAIGTDTSSPYSVIWQNASAGNYSPRATATDNLGVQSDFFLPHSLIVTANPKVTITSPSTGATYTAPAAITLTATASAWDQSGAIQKVEFFHGDNNLIGTVTTPPYTFKDALHNCVLCKVLLLLDELMLS